MRRVNGRIKTVRVRKWLRKRYIRYSGAQHLVGAVIRASNNLFDPNGTQSVTYEYFNNGASVGSGASHTTATPGTYYAIGTHTDSDGNVTTHTSNTVVVG